MGCDGWLEKDSYPKIEIICFTCGEPVDENSHHDHCRDQTGNIPVNIDIEGYTTR